MILFQFSELYACCNVDVLERPRLMGSDLSTEPELAVPSVLERAQIGWSGNEGST